MRNPEFKFVDTDTNALESSLVTAYETITKVSVKPGSPEKLFIQWMANIILQERAMNNYTGNQNIPSRADGENLNALGELFYDVRRPSAKPAHTTEKFYITEEQESAVLIPAGTRVTDASSTLFWRTLEDVYIVAGNLYAETKVECIENGNEGNGYAIGQINTIVDAFPYFDKCENTTVTDGGSNEATDDEYYELLRSSMDSLTTAGPIGSYEYHAKKVSTNIADVVPVMPKLKATATVDVYTNSGEKYAFYGATDTDESTLAVMAHGSSSPAALGTDYTVSAENGVLVIKIADDGILSSATQLDILVYKVMEGCVYLYILMDNGTLATDEVKELVLASCNADEIRPLTDKVSCHDADTVTYNIDITYYVPSNTTKSQTEMTADVQKAVSDYVAWQCARFGRDINPDKLRDLLYDAGIKRVVVNSPAFTVLNDGSTFGVPEVASIGTINVVNGGYEDE